VMPVWVGRYLMLDTSHRAFEGALLVYHQYNHPVMQCFKQLVLEHLVERRKIVGPTEQSSAPAKAVEMLTQKTQEELDRRRTNAVRMRWLTAITLTTNGPFIQMPRTCALIVGWTEQVHVAEFFFATLRMRSAYANRSSRAVLSRAWQCQSTGADLRKAENMILVQYCMQCTRRHSGQVSFPGRWHYMAFKLDSTLMWKHFGSYWGGELKPWMGEVLDKEEQATLTEFHQGAMALQPGSDEIIHEPSLFGGHARSILPERKQSDAETTAALSEQVLA